MSQKVNFLKSYGFRGGAIHLDIHGYLDQIRALAGSGQGECNAGREGAR